MANQRDANIGDVNVSSADVWEALVAIREHRARRDRIAGMLMVGVAKTKIAIRLCRVRARQVNVLVAIKLTLASLVGDWTT